MVFDVFSCNCDARVCLQVKLGGVCLDLFTVPITVSFKNPRHFVLYRYHMTTPIELESFLRSSRRQLFDDLVEFPGILFRGRDLRLLLQIKFALLRSFFGTGFVYAMCLHVLGPILPGCHHPCG